MRVLLKEGAAQATSATILVLPQLAETTLETLSGEAVLDGGVIAEARDAAVIASISAAVKERVAASITAKKLLKEVEWMSKALAPFESGSKIGLEHTGRGCALDTSAAKRINRAKGVSVGDTIVVGPTISPQVFMNARGRVLAIEGRLVRVEFDAGDRDRIERATAKAVPETFEFSVFILEAVERGS
jgi:hypothetical protein